MHRYVICCVAVILLLAPPAAATLDTTTSVVPDTGGIAAGGEVSVTARFTFDEEFPNEGWAAGTTSLVSPVWIYDVRISDIPAMEGVSRGSEFYLHGFSLSYPSPTPVTLNLTVRGTMPETGPGTAPLISVRLEDRDGELWGAMDEPLVIRRGNIGATATPTTRPPSGTGRLDIDSVPAPALVYLDGTFEGTTPCTVTGMVSREHTVYVEKDGYTPWTTVIRTRENSSTSLVAILEKQVAEETPADADGPVNTSTIQGGLESIGPVVRALADLARQMLSVLEDVCRSIGASWS
ncbi:MAG: PEGA domain-containing protein [Methanomicrobiales archaeon]